jgi:protein-L-isoaspartate(D-aspartate) O-methyltransferase
MLQATRLKDNMSDRLNMITGQLYPNGITDEPLLQAFESVPREVFLPTSVQPLAYSDGALPLIEKERWLLPPLVLAQLIQLAAIHPDDKILIIGCGTGYSLALLTQLAEHVIGLESHPDLSKIAEDYRREHEITNGKVVFGALWVGYPKEAPYDVILIEGAVAEIPPVILEQLKPTGRLVTVIKEKTHLRPACGRGVLVSKSGNSLAFASQFDVNCAYLPEFEPNLGFHL